MEKKDRKRDVAVFSNMLKDLMNEPLDDVLTTLDRDIQHFIYGRVAVLVRHNEGKPIGSLADIGTIIGAASADVISEFTKQLDEEKKEKAFSTVRENLLRGFDARTPKINPVEKDQEEPHNDTII
jgi:hypothetical protein